MKIVVSKDGPYLVSGGPPVCIQVEDPALGCSGPLWVRGGIPIVSANGKRYEARNRA